MTGIFIRKEESFVVISSFLFNYNVSMNDNVFLLIWPSNCWSFGLCQFHGDQSMHRDDRENSKKKQDGEVSTPNYCCLKRLIVIHL